MKTVACIGSITVDIIVKPADEIPSPGTLKAVENVEMYVGGCASNAAIDLAKIGIPCELICNVGNDPFGEYIKSVCEKNGVGTEGVNINPASSTTGSVVCVSKTGERSFLYKPGSTADFSLSDVRTDIIDKCEIVFVAGAFLLRNFDGKPCAEFMKKAQSEGKFTVMDTAWDFDDVWLPKIKKVIPYLDLFMPSYDEAVKITGETDNDKIADTLFDLGAKSVILKIGKDGALVCESKEKRYVLPTYLSIKPVDTTGAGDSFCAGFLAGISLGWGYKKSAQFANAVGTHCVMQIGASTGIKPLNDILKFMEEHESEVSLND